jgi:hypothetical protein
VRKFFASAFGFSLTAALVLGAAFAWSANTSGNFSTTTGTVSIGFYNYAAGPDLVYDGGGWANVEYGDFQNTTPANPGLALHLTGGSIPVITTPSVPGCAGLMTGLVNITDGSAVLPGGYVGGQWKAYLSLTGDVANACQGTPVNYTVNLVAGS